MAVELGTDLKTCPEFMRGSRQRDECEDVRSGADGTRATARATPNFCRDSIIGTLSATVPKKKKKTGKPHAGGQTARWWRRRSQINHRKRKRSITVATNIGGGIGLRGVAIRRPAGIHIFHVLGGSGVAFLYRCGCLCSDAVTRRKFADEIPLLLLFLIFVALDGVHDYYGAFHPGTGTTKPQGEFGDEPGSAVLDICMCRKLIAFMITNFLFSDLRISIIITTKIVLDSSRSFPLPFQLLQANLGDLDYRPTRHALVLGNLALLQVQALIVGSIAGLFSFAMGTITHPKDLNSYYESMLMITSAMLCAALSSLVLGTFMCALVILCRWAKINPGELRRVWEGDEMRAAERGAW
ncbi:hypothetical protein BC938DRAFT_475086 [Jimgerdemannia flammicorona]|uniref:Uncharacterized protein n=1 Tax=Jimgerdemannia flammicorona TaxID=994334 RepID=A0A433Q108_9FUNG|nr:hypothetical protein BC938DRAFT_475086 [Jimgerdemannia flammicorona]